MTTTGRITEVREQLTAGATVFTRDQVAALLDQRDELHKCIAAARRALDDAEFVEADPAVERAIAILDGRST